MQHPFNILIVDDNQENLKVVSTYLREADYNIALSLDGSGALKIIENDKIDLVLLDIMMPEMDGYEVCRILNENEKTADIPVIFLTAKNETDDLVKGFKLGGVDYITKPFKKEELLVRVKNHLELKQAKEQIIHINKSREKLYSIIAHDIRSPFSAIAQTINAIYQGYVSPNSQDFFDILGDLKTRTHETLTLLNNLLNWTRSQTGEIELNKTTVNINILILDCINLLSENAKVKGIELIRETKMEHAAWCDEITMHTVFRNLLSNAIKFTPAHGKITFSSKMHTNHIEIEISDTGIGMSDEVMRKIFEKDEHYTGTGTQNEKGTGLGLVMVKDFIKQNNGKLEVSSELNKGSHFKILLPVKSTKTN